MRKVNQDLEARIEKKAMTEPILANQARLIADKKAKLTDINSIFQTIRRISEDGRYKVRIEGKLHADLIERLEYLGYNLPPQSDNWTLISWEK